MCIKINSGTMHIIIFKVLGRVPGLTKGHENMSHYIPQISENILPILYK